MQISKHTNTNETKNIQHENENIRNENTNEKHTIQIQTSEYDRIKV